MSVFEWINIASTLPVEGLEFYEDFLPNDKQKLEQIREILQKKKMKMPMLCCSPDFTDPDEEMRRFWVEQEKKSWLVTYQNPPVGTSILRDLLSLMTAAKDEFRDNIDRHGWATEKCPTEMLDVFAASGFYYD